MEERQVCQLEVHPATKLVLVTKNKTKQKDPTTAIQSKLGNQEGWQAITVKMQTTEFRQRLDQIVRIYGPIANRSRDRTWRPIEFGNREDHS